MRTRSLLTPCCLGALALGACRSAPEASIDATNEPSEPAYLTTETSIADATRPLEPVAVPVDVDGDFENVWAYLADKYDGDGDARVTPEEYDRGDVAFARLDRDADGDIDAQDFEDNGDPIQMMMGQIGLGVYLQDDDDPETLLAEELEMAFGAYDANVDALITRSEFEAMSAERKAFGSVLTGAAAQQMETAKPYDGLVASIDENDDDALDYEEVMAFHRRFMADGRIPRLATRRGRGGAGSARPEPLAVVGAPAPDFELEPPGGGEAVRLSSFRGDRPVALVFGSYT